MRRPRLIVFDCDGVLVDSEAIANSALADALRAEGLNLGLEQTMVAFNGLAMTDVVAKAEAMIGHPLPADFVDRVQAETFAAFRGRLQPVAGALALVKAVQGAGFATCVASSGGHDKMAVTLAETGLKPLFEGRVFSADDVGKGKPAPDLFLHAARHMGAAPESVLVIEDSLPGVEAARTAGMAVVAYVPHGDTEPFSVAGARVVENLSEVLALLGV